MLVSVRSLRSTWAWAFVGFLLASGCGESPLEEPSPEPPGGVKFLFGMKGDATGESNFVAVSSVETVIGRARAELSRPVDERALHINGPIARGDGGVNLKWHWHFVRDEWDLAEVSIEVCDGNPAEVENNIDYWVDQVGRFCPWGSRVLAELDR